MNKTEFIKGIATATGFTQKDVKVVLEAAQTVAYEAMAKEEEVTIFDGLKLMGVHKDATTARNPLDGSVVQVKEKTVPKAKFGVAAKRIVNGEA